ncbi:MAG: DUF3067 family protein [Acaryochloridaceae cyanobacterium RU_4_10]|nr:DUF3067 family protein [Acaryochloridaceae cyanobacterium RU_4_10]
MSRANLNLLATSRCSQKETHHAGADLQTLLLSKWGKSYDIQFRRTQGKIFVQVMWRYLEQASFPMTPQEYQEHLEAVATYLQGWGAFEQVVNYIQSTKENPRLGKTVSIPLELGGRASEWMVEEF